MEDTMASLRVWCALVVVTTGLVCLEAAAEPPEWAEAGEIDCHFEGDDGRWALVDSRGQQGVAGGFSFELMPTEHQDFDFCPHCSLSVFVADVGLDFDMLELAGFNETNYTNIDTLISALEELASTDPEQLAMELQPELQTDDLLALAEELMGVIAAAQVQVERLMRLQAVTNLEIDFDTTDIDELADEIGLYWDSAFQADFNNPNDPRKNNSGVRVYSLQELLQAMVEEMIPEQVRSAVESLLSNIPMLPGLFEISGDDDSALSPATFHGVDTDVTIRQRTYAVHGNDAVLYQYTVVNDTRRILPLVQAAMIADFDIPPGSKDTATEYDPTSGTAMVYDEHPYAEPELHLYVGVSANLLPSTDASYLLPGNWNIDDRFSLSQYFLDDNRLKFFLFHPDVSGDHDDADGKSEKQGAVSLVMPGPWMPGEQRTVSFCIAGGAGGSAAVARTTMLTTMDACKALYGLLTPECGNGTLELGEECDTGDTEDGGGCSADCVLEECGDGRVVGLEVCDDGNTESDDGCSATCQPEVCGDGITQADEECDDGNMSNTDSCLTDCRAATCGDGFVRMGGGCGGSDIAECDLCDTSAQWCFTGRFTITDNPDQVGNPPTQSSDAFDELESQSVPFAISFDIDEELLLNDLWEGQGFAPIATRRYVTGPVSVRFGGGYGVLDDEVGPTLSGEGWYIDTAQDTDSAERLVRVGQLRGSVPRSPVEFSLGFPLSGADPDLVEVAGQPPALAPFEVITGFVQLGRLVGGTFTDFATGVRQVALEGGGEAGEACDDGNGNDHDECTSACELARCGDGIIQYAVGEFCDEGDVANGVPDSGCDLDCTPEYVEACGNGTIDPAEECDDNNTASGDGCSAECRTEVCGDGVVQAGEECDDGNETDGDGCASCVLERCGDGIVQPDEECDAGDGNAETGACLTDCRAAVCGDGATQSGVEECDDGNVEPGDGCRPDCVVERCGDGVPGPGEDCDDGNDAVGDGCSPTCQVEICGDGAPGPDETCDDGNLIDGDGCTKDCLLEDPEACGNGTVDPGEQCDDGNTLDGDGCTATCTLENPGECGDGEVQAPEECDDGNTITGDGCSRFCVVERCGDRIQQPGEQCDDGNDIAGDGCTQCTIDPAECGNGIQEFGEQCDGGSNCTDTCRVDMEDRDSLRETCGNGTLDLGEACDDGGRFEGDGCDELCRLEASVCGNGALEFGEGCDDGELEDGDGCSATCQIEGFCGDGNVDLGESCDDGNADGGDGCSTECRAEESTGEAVCGNGAVESPEECDDGDLNGMVGSRCNLVCEFRSGGGGGCCAIVASPASPWTGPGPIAVLGLLLAALLVTARRL